MSFSNRTCIGYDRPYFCGPELKPEKIRLGATTEECMSKCNQNKILKSFMNLYVDLYAQIIYSTTPIEVVHWLLMLTFSVQFLVIDEMALKF